MKWRERSIAGVVGVLLAIVVVSFAWDGHEVCPDLGGIPVKYTCYYYETITAINPEMKEVRSVVAQSVINESRSRVTDYLEMQHYEDDARNIHVSHVQEADFQKLEVGKSYMFVVTPNEPTAKLCTTEQCNLAVMKFKPFEGRT